MKIADIWVQYKEYTEEFSKNARTLAFGAVAICWFFKNPDLLFPNLIRWALFSCVSFFAMDTLQYFVSAVLYRCWLRPFERRTYKREGTIDGDVDKPAWLDWPATAFWWGKFLSLIAAYFLIGLQLFRS